MYIKCWGCRGSIPVSGERYLLFGGDTTCIEVRDSKDNIIIIDGGSGIRELGKKVTSENKFNINLIFTHVHWDHIIGLPFFPPFYNPEYHINVFGVPSIQGNILKLALEVFSAPFFPVNSQELSAKLKFTPMETSITIGDFKIETIPLSHPNGGIGIKFTCENKIFVFLTDNELGFLHKGGRSIEDYIKFCKNADLLIHDAEYTKSEYKERIRWGHSCIDDVISLAKNAEVKRIGFFHHNQNHTDEDLKEMELYAKNKLKGIESFMVYKEQEFFL